MKNIHILLTAFLLFNSHLALAQIPSVELALKNALVSTQGNVLTISTGKVICKWKWTGKGFVTTGFKNLLTDKEWVSQQPENLADWEISLFDDDVKLVSLKAEISNDNNFTTEHIRIMAEMDYSMSKKYYEESGIRLRFEIWAYPNAPGVRTQLFLKGIGRWAAPGIACSNDYRTDFLPVSTSGLTRQTIGFYNDHDGKNDDTLDFVDNHVFSKPISDTEIHRDSNILFSYNEKEGIGLVKESHKVVNKEGINTGYFKYGENKIESTGWGLALANIEKNKYLPCWASWRICWAGDEDEKQLALKTFDRMRYPITEEDKVIITNVWGAGQSVASAKEENILKEIKSSADLGIDVVQIDAGWQNKEVREKTYKESNEVYPNGWDKIMKTAANHNIKMGIWNTAASVNKVPNKLIYLNDKGFNYYKIDIGSWSTYDMLQKLTTNARELVKHSQYKAKVNWDVTHKGLRVGYFYNREYGNLFLQNRRLDKEKQKNPLSHLYVPRRILKDQWQFSSYLNINQIMFNVHVTDLVNHKYSNAHLYGDAYSFAIAMMCTPLYFTETWRFAPDNRTPVKQLISIYKTHRDNLYEGYVFALGERPDDTSWTGFQNYQPDENFGYLTLFREINNKDKKKKIQLHFIKGKKLVIEDLITGKKKNYHADNNGFVEFKMEKPASFKFYKYTIH